MTSVSMSKPSSLGLSLLAFASLSEISFSSSVIAMTLIDSTRKGLRCKIELTMQEENLNA